MGRTSFQRKEISPIGKLHEALVAQRRTFLENAEARTYQKADEIPPLPLNDHHPAEKYDKYLWPCTHFLPNMNLEIEQTRRDLDGPNDRYKRKMREKYPDPPSFLTSETFSTELIKFWGYSGKEWVVSECVFESFFPEDEDHKTVKTHWFIPGVQEAIAIERKAIHVESLVDLAIKRIEELSNAHHYGDLRDKVSSAVRGDNPQWQPGVVEWGYLKLIDKAIQEVANLARREGDTPFLSFINIDEPDRLVINAQGLSLIWRQHTIKIGDNQPFWLLYTLGEYHGEWVPLGSLAPLAEGENSQDHLKQIVYNLKKKYLGDKPWNEIVDAIEARKKAYRLNITQGVRLIPK